MSCGLGGSIAAHRSSCSLWQPRAGTAACHCLGDSLHRLTRKRLLCVSKVGAKSKAKNFWICGDIWGSKEEGKGEGQALSRSLPCCNHVLHLLKVKIYLIALPCATPKNPPRKREESSRSYPHLYPVLTVPEFTTDLGALAWPGSARLGSRAQIQSLPSLLQYPEGQRDCPGTSEQVPEEFLGV